MAKVPQSGLAADNPARPLLLAGISYWGRTTGAGSAAGNSLVDSLCSTVGLQPRYVNQGIRLINGDAGGQVGFIVAHNLTTGEMTVADSFSDYNGAVYQVPANVDFVIGAVGAGGGGAGPIPPKTKLSLPYITETWQDVLGIDFTIWNNLDVLGTGAVVRTVAADQIYVLLSGPAAGDYARLRSVQQWQFAPNYFAGTNWIYDRLTMEWEGYIGTVAQVDEAAFFMGMGSAILTTRATNNIAGFIVIGDVLYTITDRAGVETINALATTFDAQHKFRVSAWPGMVRFAVDELIVATHITNLPDAMMYLQWYLPQDAAGAGGATMRVGINGIDPDPNLL